MHTVQTSIEEFIIRLKSRYSHNNSVLDILSLIEMLREENLALTKKIEPDVSALNNGTPLV